MPIELPKGLPFSVDTWNPTSRRKRHHFLTHAHKDHSTGISTHYSYPIFCTHLTRTLLLQHHPQLDNSLFVGIEVGQSMVIDDPDGAFSVMAFDANHCPGDCRLTHECLQNLPDKYLGQKGRKPRCQLDYVFLDCTFGRFSGKIPSKHSAIRQVISCIWKHPDAPVVYLSCDLLGQEDVLAVVSQTFGSKIYVDRATNPECFFALTLTVPEILTQDPSSRFHVFNGFPELYARAKAKLVEAQANSKPQPLIIRPSTQWYACEEGCSEDENRKKQRISEAIRDQFGVWHVCYSMHSSRDELEWALQLLAPKWVISTTPSCRAMELGYVKKHCFSAQVSSNESLWKLLDLNVEASSSANVPVAVKSVHSSSVHEVSAQSSGDSKLQLVKISACQKEDLNMSPQRKRIPVTLFGRARLGLQESASHWEEEKIVNMKGKPSQAFENQLEQESSFREEEISKEPLVKKLKVEDNVAQCHKTLENESSEVRNDNQTSIGSSKCFNKRLRKLYRSMNVPVPEPLPSLVDLLKSHKRAKR